MANKQTLLLLLLLLKSLIEVDKPQSTQIKKGIKPKTIYKIDKCQSNYAARILNVVKMLVNIPEQ